MDLFSKIFQSCDHTQFRLERRPAPNPEFKFGLPGLGTALSITGKSKPTDYIYYCPKCKNNLPTNENVRWETLYNSFRPTTYRQSAPSQTSSSSTGSEIRRRRAKSSVGPSSQPRREPIGAKLRYDVLTRDNNRCVKCGASGKETRLHVDHKIPVSHGGGNEMSNLQTLCEKCNLGKGARRG